MSHSTVLVIVDSASNEADAISQAEEMLEPFDEGLEVEPYANEEISFYDFNRVLNEEGSFSEEEMLQRFSNPNEKDAKTLSTKLWVEEVRIEDGKYFSYSTYNPKSRWDWYKLGGRWENMLPSKSKRHGVDVLRKSDLDFEKGRTDAIAEATEVYDRFEQLKAGRDAGPSFDAILDLIDPSLEEQDRYALARTAYNDNPVVTEVRSEFGLYFTSPHDYFKIGKGGRYAFVEEASKSFLRTFAVLTPEGEWLEEGHMLMFGVSEDNMDTDDWNEIFWKQINEAPEDAWLLVYDVHI